MSRPPSPSKEAIREALAREAARWQSLTYEEASRLVGAEPIVYDLPSLGEGCDVEVQAFWDDRKGGDVRVTLTIGGLPGWRQFAPPGEDWIISRP